MGLTNKQRVKRTKKAKSSGFFSHVSLSTARFYYLSGDGVVYRDDVYRNCLRPAHLSVEQLLGNPNVLTRSEFKEWLDSRGVA